MIQNNSGRIILLQLKSRLFERPFVSAKRNSKMNCFTPTISGATQPSGRALSFDHLCAEANT